MSRQARFSDERGQVHVATVYYDFDLDGDPSVAPGGGILLPGVIPAGAILINGIVHILTSFAGVGAEIALIAAGPADEVLFPVVSLEPVANWDAGLKVTDILTVVAGEGDYAPQILAVDAQIGIGVTAPLTAGRMALHLTYIMSPTEVPELVA